MKRKLNRIIDILIVLIIIVCILNIVNSTYHIIEWKKDGDSVKEQLEVITEKADVVEIVSEENVEIIEQVEEVPESNPYWAFMSMKMIDADFQDLKEVNNEIVGWIQVNGTNINYPFVQGKNNVFYLTHAFDKSYNTAGWVFLDYRNNGELTDKNNILYAHGRKDGIMFGSLRNALTNGWLNNSNNFVIKIATPNESSMWQVFSVYHIPTTNDYLSIEFNSDDSFLSFANMLRERSAYDFGVALGPNDKILTLSTCYNESERVVIHAKLIKKAAK